MKNDKLNRIATLTTAAVISSAMVAPFVFLELRYGAQNYSSFPYPLFGVLWLLPTAFVVTIAPVVRSVRTGDSVLSRPVTLVFRTGLLALIAVLWMGLIRDQLPCFLGVPNCD
ncbi:MAG TPA: hypothetical protein VFL57_00915 [Bryobacteraceae bacterium]|nr:hypothetical protein [Bryobacteraceae bacterium]